MKTAVSFGGAGATGEDWPEVVEYVREAERLDQLGEALDLVAAG